MTHSPALPDPSQNDGPAHDGGSRRSVGPVIGATIAGYPRIGPRRELKRALEDFWAGRSTADDLADAGRQERGRTWRLLASSGLTTVPSNTFSLYDQMLDTAVMLGALPARYRALVEADPLAGYFALARGTGDLPPLEMTKWFDTNYHYLVPEIGPGTGFVLDAAKPLAEVAEARELGLRTRPVVIGPVTFLLLSKPSDDAPAGFAPLERLDDVLPLYRDLLGRFAAQGLDWVQLEEPALVCDRTTEELDAAERAYTALAAAAPRPAVLVNAPHGSLGEALPRLARSGIEALGLDLVHGDPDEDLSGAGLGGLTVVAGIVDGHNVWRNDLRRSLERLEALRPHVGELAVGTSCSLLHVPYGLAAESADDVPGDVRAWLAFAREKVAEVVLLHRGLTAGVGAIADELASSDRARDARATARETARDAGVQARLAALTDGDTRRGDPEARRAAQRAGLDLPLLPTTTIGSFPQTHEVRAARADLRAGRIDEAGYAEAMRGYVERTIRLQEKLGLDVLVHGEPERNDMVQYFAEQLDGFVTTRHGWVQSYGSRCVRPPILYGEVSRPEPMTVSWATFARSLTEKPVKGMLTGPVTILAWSFVRDDQPVRQTAREVALAVRDEVVDLQAAGIRVIQVDEPALRETLPLRRADRDAYLDWAIGAFRLAVSGADDATQVHTHLCYSEFGEVVGAIDALGADVTSIEAARSRMELLPALVDSGWTRDVGPGVYDIHSPRVPSAEEIGGLIGAALRYIPADRLWVNPDCGLKTRRDEEVAPALENLVEAARRARASLT